MKEILKRREITKEVKKGWLSYGEFHTDVAVDNLYNYILSNERELLIEFFKHFRDNGEKNIGMTIEQFVDDFLNIKTIEKCECGFNKRMALDCTSKPCRFKGTFTSN